MQDQQVYNCNNPDATEAHDSSDTVTSGVARTVARIITCESLDARLTYITILSYTHRTGVSHRTE